MLNTTSRRLTQKFAAVALLGVPFAALFAVTTAVNACYGMSPLYKQKRYGQDGKEFNVWKFKSMRSGNGPDSERVTPFGRLIRKASLDELPQLINIVKGEMDLVGWRPLKQSYKTIWDQHNRVVVNPEDVKFKSVEEALALIAETKPGVFGPIQISKYRGTYENGDRQNFLEIVAIELDYVQRRKDGTHLETLRQEFDIMRSVPRALLTHQGHVARDNDMTYESVGEDTAPANSL